jgi:predicted nuclease with TOPRIM domain
MSQTTKITEAEFSEIKMLQGKFEELHGRFGNLGIEKMELDRLVTEFVEKEKQLKDEWISLKKLDEGLRDKMVKTYGEGSLNMADGTFTSTVPPTTPPPK